MSKKAEGSIYGGMIASDAVDKIFKLKEFDKQNRKVYDTVSKFAQSKGINDLVLPSYQRFLKGDGATYKGVPIDLDSIYQASFIGDKRMKELKGIFGITDVNDNITEILKTMKVSNGKTK
jgi:LDH2 family malate/lactate/ureidoglycolate dehydrogenase